MHVIRQIHEVDPQQEAAATDLGDERVAFERGPQVGEQARTSLAHAVHEPAAGKRVQHRQAGCARDRRPIPGVTQVERARALVDRIVDVLLAEDGADRRVSGAQPLADRHDIRFDGQLLVGEPAADASHSGDDLVEADEKPVPLASLLEPVPELLRRRIGG